MRIIHKKELGCHATAPVVIKEELREYEGTAKLEKFWQLLGGKKGVKCKNCLFLLTLNYSLLFIFMDKILKLFFLNFLDCQWGLPLLTNKAWLHDNPGFSLKYGTVALCVFCFLWCGIKNVTNTKIPLIFFLSISLCSSSPRERTYIIIHVHVHVCIIIISCWYILLHMIQ